MLVCLDCGSTQLTIPETELGLLRAAACLLGTSNLEQPASATFNKYRDLGYVAFTDKATPAENGFNRRQ